MYSGLYFIIISYSERLDNVSSVHVGIFPLQDNKANSRGPKRCKYGAKTNSLQSQGCLQMEHFFGRSGK